LLAFLWRKRAKVANFCNAFPLVHKMSKWNIGGQWESFSKQRIWTKKSYYPTKTVLPGGFVWPVRV
jgi:hypothetical protein